MTFSFRAINISKETALSSSGKGVSAEQMSPQVNVLSFTTSHLVRHLAWVTCVHKMGHLTPASLGTVSLLESHQTNNPLGTLSSVSHRVMEVEVARK